jgi:hypothetical protein
MPNAGAKIVRAIFFAVDSHFLRFGLASADSGATRKPALRAGVSLFFVGSVLLKFAL